MAVVAFDCFLAAWFISLHFDNTTSNDGLRRMWQYGVVTCSRVLLQYFPSEDQVILEKL